MKTNINRWTTLFNHVWKSLFVYCVCIYCVNKCISLHFTAAFHMYVFVSYFDIWQAATYTSGVAFYFETFPDVCVGVGVSVLVRLEERGWAQCVCDRSLIHTPSSSSHTHTHTHWTLTLSVYRLIRHHGSGPGRYYSRHHLHRRRHLFRHLAAQ